MITNLIVDFLNKKLSDYFENVDTSQLDVSLWRGEAAFQNLRLKNDLLESFGLPFKIITGICGNLKLKVPWSAIFTSPIEVSVKNLYIIAIPGTAASVNEENEANRKHEFKMRVVEGIQAAQLHQQQLRQQSSPSTSEPGNIDNRSYFEKLLLYLINNIQIEISSVHIRYEDLGFSRLNSSISSKTFSFGVILNRLSLQTTDKNWVPGYIAENAWTHYKMANMEGFAIYWNSDNSEVSKMFVTDEDRCSNLKDIMTSKQPQLKFIIGPLSTQSQVTLTPSPEKGPKPFSLPTVSVSVIIQELEVSLTNQQFQDAIYLMNKLDSLYRQQRWRKYRPDVSTYKGNYRLWWKYGYSCILEKVRRRRQFWRWSYIKQHRRTCKEYHDALCKKIAMKSVLPEIVMRVDSLERDLDAFNIILVRNQVTITLQKKAQRMNDSNIPAPTGWFSGWFSSRAEQNEHEESLEFIVHELSSEEKAGLFEAIGYSEAAVPVTYPPDFIDFLLEFQLERLRVIAKAEDDKRDDDILTLEVRKIKTSFSSRPVNFGMELKLLLGSIEILGIKNKTKLLRCRLSHNFFEIIYERFPLDSNVDQRVFVRGLPLEIVYSWKTIQELINCFCIPEDLSMDILQVKAAKKLIEWKAYSRASLQHILENRGKFEINLNMTAPNLVIPQNGEIRRAQNILVFQLGSIQVTTKHPDRHSGIGPVVPLHPHGGIHPAVAKQYYETFLVELRDFKVMIKVNGINKQLVKSGEILARIDQCVVTDDPRLPQIKIFTTLSLIDVEITELRLNNLINLLTALPIPEFPYPTIPVEKSAEVSEFEAINRIAAMRVSKNRKMSTKLTFCVIQIKVESFKISVAIE